ncbi:hypothetical protein OH77DRAFT_1429817 [Trametes cingulata]|nr:hypothetical protein OH77DRAFT_1429817 [Trametes cingulata]
MKTSESSSPTFAPITSFPLSGESSRSLVTGRRAHIGSVWTIASRSRRVTRRPGTSPGRKVPVWRFSSLFRPYVSHMRVYSSECLYRPPELESGVGRLIPSATGEWLTPLPSTSALRSDRLRSGVDRALRLTDLVYSTSPRLSDVTTLCLDTRPSSSSSAQRMHVNLARLGELADLGLGPLACGLQYATPSSDPCRRTGPTSESSESSFGAGECRPLRPEAKGFADSVRARR